MAVYLIDFENVKSEGLKGCESLTKDDRVWIFYSNNADSLSFEAHERITKTEAQVEIYKVKTGGKNALDFQLATYLGYLIKEEKDTAFYIVSKDGGFSYICDFWAEHCGNGSCIVKMTPTILKTLEEMREAKVVKKASKNEPSIKETTKKEKTKKKDKVSVSCVVPIKTKSSMNQNIKNMIKGKCKAEQEIEIVEFLKKSESKNALYVCLVKAYGQEEGLKLYKALKGNYKAAKELSI